MQGLPQFHGARVPVLLAGIVVFNRKCMSFFKSFGVGDVILPPAQMRAILEVVRQGNRRLQRA